MTTKGLGAMTIWIMSGQRRWDPMLALEVQVLGSFTSR